MDLNLLNPNNQRNAVFQAFETESKLYAHTHTINVYYSAHAQ